MSLDFDLNLNDVDYHKPQECSRCGGKMIYKGVGEYSCENCHCVEYDDYGKVRNYLETHSGANAHKVEQDTGVPMKVIRALIKDDRLGFLGK